MRLPVYNSKGEFSHEIEARDDVFGVPFNQEVVHQALVCQQANARRGSAKAKTRSEVSGSTRKLYPQKHTGRARAGSIKSPLRRGGGVIFGPRPRDYEQNMPRKMRRLALRCVLSAKAEDGEVKVVEEITLEKPRTRIVADILRQIGVLDSVLVATSEPSSTLVLSLRNLPHVRILPARMLNVSDLLAFKNLLLTEASLWEIERLWGGSNAEYEVNDATA